MTHRIPKALLFLCCLLLCSSTALAQEYGQKDGGFVIQANVGGRVGLIDTISGSGTGTSSVSALGNNLDVGLLLGFKMGRVILGLGLDFINFTINTNSSVVGTPSSTTAASVFLLVPEVQAAIVRSADRRVEMIGDFALGMGHLFESGPGFTSTDSNFLLSYQVGPGVRYWPHRHFAVQALAGFAGNVYFDLPPAGTTTSENYQAHSLFASLGAMAVF